MSAASKFGAVFGAGLLGFALLGSPAMAGADTQNKKDNGGESATTDAAPGNADRDVETGGSGTQGRSTSNPDGEGVDKPYAAAGQAAESQGEDDFDGNNGCGNDTDFADDNNGNCGGLKKGHAKADTGDEQADVSAVDTTSKTEDHGSAATARGATATAPADELSSTETATTAGAVADGMATREASGAQVLGLVIERGAAGESAVAAAPASGGAQVLGMEITRGAPAALAMTGGPLGLLALIGFGLVGAGAATRRFARARA